MSLADDLGAIKPAKHRQKRRVSDLVKLLDRLHVEDPAGYRALVERLDDPSIYWGDIVDVLREHHGAELNIGPTTIAYWRDGRLRAGAHPIGDA